MGAQTGICIGKTVLECYVQPDAAHGGYGIRIVRSDAPAHRDEYCCALGLAYDPAEQLAYHLYSVHATPEDAEDLIEDWLYDHADAVPAVRSTAQRV